MAYSANNLDGAAESLDMPTRKVVIADAQSAMIEKPVRDDQAKLEALRAAALIGIADIEAGRYRTFGSIDDLQEALDRMANEALD